MRRNVIESGFVQDVIRPGRASKVMRSRGFRGGVASLCVAATAACGPGGRSSAGAAADTANCVPGYSGGICTGSPADTTPNKPASTTTATTARTSSSAATSTEVATTSVAPTTTESTPTTTSVTTTSAEPTPTTAASSAAPAALPTRRFATITLSFMNPANECGEGGQTGDVLIAKNSPACELPDGTPDGFVLNKQNSAGNYVGPKVGGQVLVHCYITGDPYETTVGPRDMYAVIGTDPSWAQADNSGQAAENGYIALVPAAALGVVAVGQDPIAKCQPGYDPYGIPSVTNQS